MTSDSVRFRSIQIDGFRGFRDPIHLDLDASAVILAGPNGAGKTSFCDAIQWLLLGSVGRLESASTRRDADPVANIYRSSGSAMVQAEMTFRDGTAVVVRRSGGKGRGVLEWSDASGVVTGDDAEAAARAAFSLPRKADLGNFLLRSAILQQDMIRSVLEDSPAERYKNLAALLGLDDIEEFKEEVGARSARLAGLGDAARDALRKQEVRLDEARRNVDGVAGRLGRRSDVSASRSALQRRLASLEFFSAASILTLANDSAVDLDITLQEIQRLGALLGELASRGKSIGRQLDRVAGDLTADIARADEQVTEAAAGLADVAGGHDALVAADAALRRQSDQVAQLAALAVPLLGPECPVCRQAIDAQHVAAELAANADESLARLQESQSAVEESQRRVADAEAKHRDAVQAAEALAARALEAERLEAAARSWSSEIRRVLDSVGSSLGADIALESSDLVAVERVMDEMRVVWSALTEFNVHRGSISHEAELVRAQADVEKLEERVQSAREAAQAASTAQDDAAGLERATVRAAAAVMSRRSAVMAPIVQDIFQRLDPHPTLRNLDFKFDVYYERGNARAVVRDLVAEVEANPLLVLSSSQMNVAALACFLALAWATGQTSPGFLLLDDPLQSLDDVNALGFADVCRHLREERQVLLSTHDRRLSSLLRRKLAPRVEGQRTLVLDFQAWAPEGPVIEASEVLPEVDVGSRRVLVGDSPAA